MKINKLGKVLELCSADSTFKGLPRPIVDKLVLKEGYGIENDKFAGGDLDKTVMIIGKNSYDMAQEAGIDLSHGSFGENILLDFDPHEFAIGTIFEIEDAIIEITERCSICNHLSVFGSKLPKLIKKHRGIYCKILKSGVVLRDMMVCI